MSFSFGTSSSAPATTGLSGGFSFGANKPATPGFGLAATSQPSTGLFGNTPSTAAPSFGTPSFGSTSFGAGATTTPAFGTSSAATGFGTTTPAFGATSTAPTFGAATTTPAFGATAAPSFGTTAPSFGTTGLGTGGLNFGGTPAANTGLSFGAPATTTAAGLGGLGGFSFGQTTTQSSFSLFGGTTTATTSSSLFGGKLGTMSAIGPQLSTSVTPSLGLGGLAPSGIIGASNTTSDAKSESPKQQKVPNEFSTAIESFKEFVKKQKSLSSDVMRASIKPLHTVGREAEARGREASSLLGEVSRGRAASRRLRTAAAAALAAADLAASHPGTELEGSAPPSYVKELISELEQHLITFRRQMEIADKQMQSSPKLLTEQELNQGFRRMHESLVALAGRLQTVHTQVEAQKEQYLNLRKYILKDPTNVFETPTQISTLDQILKDVDSGRKKLKPGNLADTSQHRVGMNDSMKSIKNVNQLAGPTPFSYIAGGLSPFPLVDNTGPSWQPQATPIQNTTLNTSFGVGTDSSGFQLQKPPGKRGKQ